MFVFKPFKTYQNKYIQVKLVQACDSAGAWSSKGKVFSHKTPFRVRKIRVYRVEEHLEMT